jgi:hypothetical protein
VRLHDAAPGLPFFDSWRLARLYLAREARKEPTHDLDMLVAFAPWRSGEEGWHKYFEAVLPGWVLVAPRFLVEGLRRGEPEPGATEDLVKADPADRAVRLTTQAIFRWATTEHSTTPPTETPGQAPPP